VERSQRRRLVAGSLIFGVLIALKSWDLADSPLVLPGVLILFVGRVLGAAIWLSEHDHA